VSSANNEIGDSVVSAMLLTYSRSNKGLKTGPCGIPQFIKQAFEQLSLIITIWLLPPRYKNKRSSKDPSIPNCCNL